MGAALDYYVGQLNGQGEAEYTGADAFGADVTLAGDVADNSKMQVYQTATGGLRPWWETVAQYGLVKLIDNKTAPTQVQGNVYPGSYAGQNGQTYMQRGQMVGGQPAQAGFGLVELLLLGGIALMAAG